MESRIKKIYHKVYYLFREDTDTKKYQYVRRNWIFPNHINIMINIIKKLCKKYNGNIEICILAAILHDTGLVYQRTTASTFGHEDRSIDYSIKILQKYKYSKNEIISITKCIKSTDVKYSPQNINEKIVRTADSLSQFTSVHFFAKAVFSENINEYIKWLEKKVENNYKKICFIDEKNQIKPIKNYIINAINSYNSYNGMSK